MNADGSGLARLTNNSADRRGPVLVAGRSAHRVRIHRDGNLDIYAMNADGSGLARLTNQLR